MGVKKIFIDGFWVEQAAGGGPDNNAIHKNIDAEISALPEKVTPVDDDLLLGENSEDGFSKVKIKKSALGGGSSLPVDDTTFIAQDPADNTKKIRFDLGASTTGAETTLGVQSSGNRTIVFPDSTGVILLNLVEDTTPQLGGNLDENGFTIAGRDVATDGTKLDGIETSATTDQTDAEIATAVEAATDSNTFTDADHTKLNGIETAAEVNVMQSIPIKPQMRSGGTAKPTLIGTTVGEEWRASLMSLNDTWITEVWLPTGYGGGGITTKIFGSMVSATTNDVKFELSLERMGTTATIQNLHGASGFATAQNSGDDTVPGTAGDPFFSTVTNASGAEMDSTVAGERFRLKLKRITATGTDATGDFEFGGMLLDEQ